MSVAGGGHQNSEIAKVKGPIEHLFVCLTKEHSKSSHIHHLVCVLYTFPIHL